MQLNKTKSGGKSSIPKMGKGTYPARLHSIVGLGMQHRDPYQGDEKPDCEQVIFTFEFPTKQVEIDGEMKPRIFSKTYNVFTSENAALPKTIEALDPDGDLSGFGERPEGLLGAPCMAEIGATSTGNDKIVSISAPVEGLVVPDAEIPGYMFDFDNPSTEVFEQLPQWIQNNIRSAVNFNDIAAVIGTPEPEDGTPY